MADLKPSDVLSRAADLIEPEGAWRQGGGASKRGAICIVEAVARCAPKGFCWLTALAPLEAAIGSKSLTSWNDTPSRTQAEVVAFLRAASDLAKAEGQ